MTARLAIMALGLVICASSVLAGVPGLMNFQGILKDNLGDPVADGPYFVTFRIFTVPAGGSALWSDTQTVSTTDGLFNATLGTGTPIPDTVFIDDERYLGISVFPDGEMNPRQRFVTSAYTFMSVHADTSAFSDTSAYSGTSVNSYNTAEVGANTTNYVPKWDGFALVTGMIYDNGTNVGIGVAVPSEKLEVAGKIYSNAAGGGFKFPDGTVQTTAAVPPNPGAVVYTRWGRTICPAGSSLVYEGIVGGKHYTHAGSGSNLLCMSKTPTWDVFSDLDQNGALLYGTEYEMGGYGLSGSLGALHDFEVPCAVCLKDTAQVVLMQPGTQVCPGGWNLEYAGYLMSTHYTQSASEFICVDRVATSVGSVANAGGSLLYPTEAECGSLPCGGGMYVQNREITCSVCSK